MHQKGDKTAVDNIDTRPDSSNSIKENTATGYSQRHLFNGIILRRSHFPRKLCREKRTSRRVGGGGERSLSLARLFFSLGRPKLYRPTRPGTVVTEFVWQHKAVLEGPSEVERRRGALMYWRLQGKRDEGCGFGRHEGEEGREIGTKRRKSKGVWLLLTEQRASSWA